MVRALLGTRTFSLVTACAFALLANQAAHAAFKIKVESSGGTTLVIEDNGPSDTKGNVMLVAEEGAGFVNQACLQGNDGILEVEDCDTSTVSAEGGTIY